MAIAKGVCLGPYEILSHLGSGGMGEVWRARDKRISRDVAVKILPDTFDARDESLKRFEQEARAAGGLNHPGLVTIFDVGTTNGSPYIVMELLEGQTLRDIIGEPEPAPLPMKKAIDYAIQIASALAVAHEKGIIHRDLKPENLFVTTDRRVKILDFGLAKLAPDSKDSEGKRRTSKHITSAGIAVGTPGYMSPEQVRGEAIDHRTDIFSLGSVMYEMISGKPAFERFSAIETMHAVLRAEPEPLETLAPHVSAALVAIVHHCMEKEPRERFQSARDLAFQLRMLPDANNSVTAVRVPIVPGQKRFFTRRVTMFALAGLLAMGAAGGFAVLGMRNHAPRQSGRAFQQLTYADGLETFPALAPDGKSFAYVASTSGNRDIYVQRVDGRTAINVTADSPEDDSEPAFSPDGSQIAFRSERDGGGIYVMGVTGESPRRLTDFGHNPAWSPDGTQLVIATEGIELVPYARARMSELWMVDARSGARRPIVQPRIGGPDFGRDSDAVQPSWSPHGKRIAFWGISSMAGQRDIWTLDPNAAEPKKTAIRVTTENSLHWNPVWSPDGKYLYYGSDQDGTLNLWRVPIDEDTGSPSGAPESIGLPASAAGNFAFSTSGEVAYVAVTNSQRLMAMAFDAHAATLGPPRQIFGGSQEILTFAPSPPDGRMIAYTTGGSTQEDIFVADADGNRIRQLTNDPAKDRSAEWSPDGKTLYFYSNREEDAYHIWSIRADGSGLTRITDNADLKQIGARNVYSPVPSPDGKTLVAQTDRNMSMLIHLDRQGKARIEPLSVFLPASRWSPDGQSIVSADPVREVISLYSLRTGKAETLAEGGMVPSWTPDGTKIVYFDRKAARILDLASRTVKAIPFETVGGLPVGLNAAGVRLSRDGSTLYVRQLIPQGDIWIARFPTE